MDACLDMCGGWEGGRVDVNCRSGINGIGGRVLQGNVLRAGGGFLVGCLGP